MRKWHRWLSFLFGAFILFIAATGVLSQIGSLVNNGGFEKEAVQTGTKQAAALGAAIVAPASAHEHEEPAVKPSAAFKCPADMTCRPKRVAKPGDWDLGFLHHIHSGEQFGPVGVVISLASGLALLFFAFSGLWMYIYMFTRRARKTHHHGGKFFW